MGREMGLNFMESETSVIFLRGASFSATLIVLALMPWAIFLLPFLRHRTGFLGRTLGQIGEYLAWHLPLVSRFARRRAVAQYALAAGSLMEAGLPTVESLEIAASAGGSVYLPRGKGSIELSRRNPTGRIQAR